MTEVNKRKTRESVNYLELISRRNDLDRLKINEKQ